MAFYKTAIIVTLLLLSACGGLGTKKSSEDTVEIAPEATDPNAPLTIIPDPYLQQQNKAPAAAAEKFKAAIVAMQAEDWPAASQILQSLIQNYPDLSGPYVNLGIVRSHQQQLEEAETLLKKAIEVNPLNNDAYNQLGVLLREQGRFDEAETCYQKALQVWPHSPATLRNLGILYDLYMGKFNQALASYELALKVSPEPSTELQGWIIDIKRRMAESEGASS